MDFNESSNIKKLGADYNLHLSKREDCNFQPKYRWRLQTLADILDGKHHHSLSLYRKMKILYVTMWLGNFNITKLDVYIQCKASNVAPNIAKYSHGSSPSHDWWAYNRSCEYSTASNAAHLECKWCDHFYQLILLSWSSSPVHEACLKRSAYGGQTDDESLALITINPARQSLNLWIGRIIEEGKQGDFVNFMIHIPFCLYSPQYFVECVKYLIFRRR